MKYNQLQVTANKTPKRVGRGISAGQGKTAGRGTKGQKARTGHRKMPAMFSGNDQTTLHGVPKRRGDGKGVRHFTINTRYPVQNVYTDVLSALSGDVDNFALAEAGLITSPYVRVKIITRGDITAKIDLKTNSASKSAIESIKKAGGTFTKSPTPPRPKTTTEKSA